MMRAFPPQTAVIAGESGRSGVQSDWLAPLSQGMTPG